MVAAAGEKTASTTAVFADPTPPQRAPRATPRVRTFLPTRKSNSRGIMTYLMSVANFFAPPQATTTVSLPPALPAPLLSALLALMLFSRHIWC